MRLEFSGNGVGIDNGLLWIDAPRPKRLCVVTHAHGDHVAKHATILCTPATAALVRLRTGGDSKFIEVPYGEKTAVGDLAVTLLPAGHILGSAMALIEGPPTATRPSLLFTGDVHLEGNRTCPPATPVHADTLVTESTFGRPDQRLPPAETVRLELAEFAHECLEMDITPVFLAYALGKAQEVMAILVEAGVPIAAHGAVWNLCRVYRSCGHAFPRSRKLGRGGRRRAALVVPPRFRKTPEVMQHEPLRIAAVTGWGDRALQPGVERSFPLSDHSDFGGLVRLVEQVAPQKVYTIHGYAREFAEQLRARGFDAEAVEGHSGPDEGVRPGMFGAP